MQLDGTTGPSMNRLGNRLATMAEGAPAGGRLSIVPVRSAAHVARLAEAGVETDYRARTLPPSKAAPTWEGVAFDPARIRTQSFAYELDGRPVGVSTVVIEPSWWIAQKRFMVPAGDHLVVRGFDAVTEGAPAEFTVVPGWSYVLPEHRGEFTRWGARVLIDLIRETVAAAPAATWCAVEAAGPVDFLDREILAPIFDRGLGARVEYSDLPVRPEDFATARPESRATVTFARMLGWPQVVAGGGLPVSEQKTLGPVFARAAFPADA